MKLVLVFSSLLLLASCSKVKELEDRTKNMEDTMEKMQETTGGMKDTTEEMNETMYNMDGNMTNMYLQSRQKETADSRAKGLKVIKDRSTRLGTKINAGKWFFNFFEYQLWAGRGVDDEHYRDELLADAMEELYRKLNDFHVGVDVSRRPNLENSNVSMNTKVFYILAATVDHINDLQQFNVKRYNKRNKTNTQVLSMLDIIESAYDKYNDPEQTLELTLEESVAVRGFNLRITKDLLKARKQFLDFYSNQFSL